MTMGILPQSPLIKEFYAALQGPDAQSLAKKICQRDLPDCAVIDDVSQYQSFYNRQVAQESSCFDRCLLTEWGIYDVSCIKSPEKDDRQLTFYVEDRSRVPHKVTVDLFSQHIDCGPLPEIY